MTHIEKDERTSHANTMKIHGGTMQIHGIFLHMQVQLWVLPKDAPLGINQNTDDLITVLLSVVAQLIL